MTSKTNTATSDISSEKNGPHQPNTAAIEVPRSSPYVLPVNQTPSSTAHLRKYRGLRITLAVLSGVIGLLALASFIIDIVICAKASKYSGYDRRKAEKEAGSGDQSMEGESLSLGLFQFVYAVCVIFAAYCLVVMLVCFILTFTSSHRVLAPGCCPSVCLAITVMIGVALSAVEAVLFFVFPAEDLVQLGPLPVVRAVIMLAYFIIVVVCACTFDDEPAYYYQ